MVDVVVGIPALQRPGGRLPDVGKLVSTLVAPAFSAQRPNHVVPASPNKLA